MTNQKIAIRHFALPVKVVKKAQLRAHQVCYRSDIQKSLNVQRIGAGGKRRMVVGTDQHTSNSYIEEELHARLLAVGDAMKSDAIACFCPIIPPLDDFVRDAIEDIEDRRRSLTVILETTGGYIETAERIADTLRRHYPREITFVVPNQAMSAGTVLVMCGDHILMDYYSTLGPIDPQIPNKMMPGDFIPALGYLAKYQELMAKSAAGSLTEAELAYLVAKFDPAELHNFEQARQLSVDLLQKWLVQYKFRKWNRTATSGKRVTLKMKRERAAEIAMKLNEISHWKSHARGLSRDIIEKELKLVVRDFGADPALNKPIRAYYRLLRDYMQRRGQEIVIHTRRAYMSIP